MQGYSKEKVIRLISQGNIETAFKEIESSLSGSSKNTLVNLKRRYVDINDRESKGFLTSDERNKALSLLTRDFLTLIDSSIEPISLDEPLSQNYLPQRKAFAFSGRILIYISTSFVLIFGIFFLFKLKQNFNSSNNEQKFYYSNQQLEGEAKPDFIKEIKANIYLDNTGSMSGYFNKDSEFLETLQLLDSRLRFRGYCEGGINLANSELNEIDFSIEHLAPTNLRKYGDITVPLSEIINNVLISEEKDQISMIFTDLVPNLYRNENLLSETSKITNSLLNKIQHSSTSFFIIQLSNGVKIISSSPMDKWRKKGAGFWGYSKFCCYQSSLCLRVALGERTDRLF